MVSTHLTNILVKIASFPQVGVNIKHIWNHLVRAACWGVTLVAALFSSIQAEETRFFSSAALLRREGGALGLGPRISRGEDSDPNTLFYICAAFLEWWMLQNKKCFFWKNVFRLLSSFVRCDSIYSIWKRPLSWRMWWCGSQTYLTVSTIFSPTKTSVYQYICKEERGNWRNTWFGTIVQHLESGYNKKVAFQHIRSHW